MFRTNFHRFFQTAFTNSGTVSGFHCFFVNFLFSLSWLLAFIEHVLCILVLHREKVGVLIGDEEEAKRWNNRFSGESRETTETQLDRYTNSSVAATSNTDKVSGIICIIIYSVGDCCSLICIGKTMYFQYVKTE